MPVFFLETSHSAAQASLELLPPSPRKLEHMGPSVLRAPLSQCPGTEQFYKYVFPKEKKWTALQGILRVYQKTIFVEKNFWEAQSTQRNEGNREILSREKKEESPRFGAPRTSYRAPEQLAQAHSEHLGHPAGPNCF